MAVLRRVITVTAVMVAAGLAVAGCAPIKMGAAAIVGNNSVSIAQLDTDSGMLAAAAKKSPPQQPLTQQQITQKTLGWLIQFQIADQLASQNGITVTSAQEQQAINDVLASNREEAEQNGAPASSVTLNAIMIANGIAPSLQPELGQYVAIQEAFVKSANGGTEPTTQAEATAADNKYSHATCEAAKSLDIKVNPQFGRMSYTQYTVIDSANTVSLPSGTIPSTEPGGLSPAC